MNALPEHWTKPDFSGCLEGVATCIGERKAAESPLTTLEVSAILRATTSDGVPSGDCFVTSNEWPLEPHRSRQLKGKPPHGMTGAALRRD